MGTPRPWVLRGYLKGQDGGSSAVTSSPRVSEAQDGGFRRDESGLPGWELPSRGLHPSPA